MSPIAHPLGHDICRFKLWFVFCLSHCKEICNIMLHWIALSRHLSVHVIWLQWVNYLYIMSMYNGIMQATYVFIMGSYVFKSSIFSFTVSSRSYWVQRVLFDGSCRIWKNKKQNCHWGNQLNQPAGTLFFKIHCGLVTSFGEMDLGQYWCR